MKEVIRLRYNHHGLRSLPVLALGSPGFGSEILGAFVQKSLSLAFNLALSFLSIQDSNSTTAFCLVTCYGRFGATDGSSLEIDRLMSHIASVMQFNTTMSYL